MINTVVYGKTKAENNAEENAVAREIARQITCEIQVSQRQLVMIMFCLAQNIENNDEMRRVIEVLKSLRTDLFIASDADS